jgi:uncharacterized protein (DUF983 family)
MSMASDFDRSRAAWFRSAEPGLWLLPPRGPARLLTLIGRAFSRRCPYCGGRGIFRTWWSLKETCPTCGIRFEREEGYFVGTYAVNIVATEFLALGIVAALLIWGDFTTLVLQIIGVTLAVAFPIIGYPIAALIWIGIDLMADPPERAARDKVARPTTGSRTT